MRPKYEEITQTITIKHILRTSNMLFPQDNKMSVLAGQPIGFCVTIGACPEIKCFLIGRIFFLAVLFFWGLLCYFWIFFSNLWKICQPLYIKNKNLLVALYCAYFAWFMIMFMFMFMFMFALLSTGLDGNIL